MPWVVFQIVCGIPGLRDRSVALVISRSPFEYSTSAEGGGAGLVEFASVAPATLADVAGAAAASFASRFSDGVLEVYELLIHFADASPDLVEIVRKPWTEVERVSKRAPELA